MLHEVNSTNIYRLAGLPKKFWPETYKPKIYVTDKKLQKYVKQYIKNIDDNILSGNGIIVFGENGLGKTHELAKIFVASLEAGKKSRFIRASVLSSFTGSIWQAKASKDFGILKKIEARWKDILSCDTFLIDDFNRSEISTSPASKISLEHTIKWRLDHNKTTLITSNHTRHKFKAEFGENIYDWLQEHNKFITVNGDSVRSRIQRKTEI